MFAIELNFNKGKLFECFFNSIEVLSETEKRENVFLASLQGANDMNFKGGREGNSEFDTKMKISLCNQQGDKRGDEMVTHPPSPSHSITLSFSLYSHIFKNLWGIQT